MAKGWCVWGWGPPSRFVVWLSAVLSSEVDPLWCDFLTGEVGVSCRDPEVIDLCSADVILVDSFNSPDGVLDMVKLLGWALDW